MKNFVNYLLKKFKTESEGISYFKDDENSIEQNFENELNDFFDRLIIYKSDAIKIISKFPDVIINEAMTQIKTLNLDVSDYSEPESFLSLSFNTITENYYNDFFDVFKSH